MRNLKTMKLGLMSGFSMSLANNILYQKKYFREVYDFYLDNAENELALSMEEGEIEKEEKEYVLILVENFKVTLEDIFRVKIKEGNLEDINDIIIRKNYRDDVIIDYYGDTCSVTCIHPYRVKDNYIRFVRKLNNKNVKKASIIIIQKELGGFESLVIKGREHKALKVFDLEGVRDGLINFKAYYNEGVFMEKTLDFKKVMEIDTTLLEKGFEVAVGMDWVNRLNESILTKRDKNNVCKEIYDDSLLVYEKKAREVIYKYLTGDFTGNFIIIDKLLKSKENLRKSLYEEFVQGFLITYDSILSENSKSGRYIKIMDSGILNIDKVLSKELSNLNKEVNNVQVEGKW